MKQPGQRSDRPIGSALNLFGDKRPPLVMRDQLFRSKSHYREFPGLRAQFVCAGSRLTDITRRTALQGVNRRQM
jgi:hypothetical protein